jgi:hypothetical protein
MKDNIREEGAEFRVEGSICTEEDRRLANRFVRVCVQDPSYYREKVPIAVSFKGITRYQVDEYLNDNPPFQQVFKTLKWRFKNKK